MPEDNIPIVYIVLLTVAVLFVLVLLPPGALDFRADREAPVANAGPDAIVGLGSSFTFDWSASTDDKQISEYLWSVEYQPNVFVFHGERATFVFDKSGTFDVTLTVIDTVGNEATDTMKVTVTA